MWCQKLVTGQFQLILAHDSCKTKKAFCNRGAPCARCAKLGIQCLRDEGLTKAQPFKSRSSGYDEEKPELKRVPTRQVNPAKQERIRLAPRRTLIKMEVEPLHPKPEARGKPLVWADTRQELCEGVPYFRSYQAGIYYRNEVAFGYLLDGFGAERDFIGSHVVISHG